jgi:hypothetical protein
MRPSRASLDCFETLSGIAPGCRFAGAHPAVRHHVGTDLLSIPDNGITTQYRRAILSALIILRVAHTCPGTRCNVRQSPWLVQQSGPPLLLPMNVARLALCELGQGPPPGPGQGRGYALRRRRRRGSWVRFPGSRYPTARSFWNHARSPTGVPSAGRAYVRHRRKVPIHRQAQIAGSGRTKVLSWNM